MPNSKPRPDHSVTYDGQCRTTNSTASISRRPAATDVLTIRFGNSLNCRTISTEPTTRRRTAHHVQTTRLGAIAITVERSVSHQSPDAKHHTTFRSPGFVRWLLPWNVQNRTYLPTPKSKPRPNHPISHNGHYRTRISTVRISR